jgi:hypothetical protein
MIYAIIADNIIVSHGSASVLWPDTSFSSLGPDASFLAEVGAVAIRSDAPYDPATEISKSCAPYLLAGRVFNTIAAPIPQPPPPPPPAPDWAGFQTELLQSATFAAARIQARAVLESELPTAEGVRQQRLLRAATALSDIGAVVLAAASQNNPTLFVGAWLILRQANLVSSEVAIGMTQIATAYHLPEDLIRSLGAPER